MTYVSITGGFSCVFLAANSAITLNLGPPYPWGQGFPLYPKIWGKDPVMQETTVVLETTNLY